MKISQDYHHLFHDLIEAGAIGAAFLAVCCVLGALLLAVMPS